MSWLAVLVLAGGAYGFKLVGVLVGGRFEAPLVRQAILLLPPAMFAAVIVLQTFERSTELVLDARVVGLVVASVAAWRKLPFFVVIVAAMAATALVRAIAG